MSSAQDISTIYGVPTKYVSLVTLVVQNSSLVLIMRYSRILPGPRYLTSTAVVLSELLKCIICLFVHVREQRKQYRYSQLPTLSHEADASSGPSGYSIKQLGVEIFGHKSGFFKLLVPAVLYTLQNNLQFVAASNLDAATFQVTYQCKILTTAVFAVLMLGQKLSATKWSALVILTAGVACVQIPSSTSTSTSTSTLVTTSAQQGNYMVGIIAVGIACLCSGFSGVYFERVLKTSQHTSIWIRNIQLSVGCLGIAVAGTLVWDGQAIRQHGFFRGYNVVVVATICIQAAGGLIVAMVIKYADNILKGFATSLSIILSTVASIFLFSFVPNLYFVLGSMLVFGATFLYSMPDSPKAVEGIASDEVDEEKVPRLMVEDYDSSDSSPHRSPFMDESEFESGDERASDCGASVFDADDGSHSQNSAPSLMQPAAVEQMVPSELDHAG